MILEKQCHGGKADLLVQMDKLTLATNTNMEKYFFCENQKNMENFK
jgi:hypothetical protein